MAETPKKSVHLIPKSNQSPNLKTKSYDLPKIPAFPPTPSTQTPIRRSSRLISSSPIQLPGDAESRPPLSRRGSSRTSLDFDSKTTPRKPNNRTPNLAKDARESSLQNPETTESQPLPSLHVSSLDFSSISTPKKTINETPTKNTRESKRKVHASDVLSPISPERTEIKRRKVGVEGNFVARQVRETPNVKSEGKKFEKKLKKKVYFRKVMYDGFAFSIGDDVYVKRKVETISDDEDLEIEECKLCFQAGDAVMIECDDCLGGFHLKCLKPPLNEVPEGHWICGFCEGRKSGKDIQWPKPPPGKKMSRTAREKLLSGDLWAAHIESLWKEVDGTYWFRGRWYIIPEETAAGRQPHNLKRELYRTNDFADVEMECVIRHCNVMIPREFAKADNEGDDVFLCEYEYDVHWHNFKRLTEIDNVEEGAEETVKDEDWVPSKAAMESDTDDDIDYEDETRNGFFSASTFSQKVAANSKKGRIYGLQKIGMKKIPEHLRCHKQTELEKAKSALLLATLPKCPPCRTKEMEEITSFVKGAICNNQCLGRCLYIHGVPGTGKTMSVLSVMRSLKAEVDAGRIKPYCFVEVNGLKLATAETIYKVIYEALTGHRVNWKKALQCLTEQFSNGSNTRKRDDHRPCVLLIDELDLLVTRNQSVMYNILDWPTRPNSKLVVIGIANTMDLPEKLLPRISSRMGLQRLCFGPYNHQQLQEIISERLQGIDVYEKQAIEFASRKVAAISGDARRALEICRRAAELTDYRIKKLNMLSNDSSTGKRLVGMGDVDAAIQEMFQAPHIQVMRSCSKLSKIFLVAVVHELYKTGMGETTFEKLARTVSELCASNREEFPGWDTLLRVGCKLGECRIILCEAGVKHRLQKLQLNFPSDDVAFALKDSSELPWLAKYL